MNQIALEVHEQLNFQASLLRLMNRLEPAVSTVTGDEKVAVEVEKLASRL
jgi:hypothetical protein